MNTNDTFLRTSPNGDIVDIREVVAAGCCPQCFEYVEETPCGCPKPTCYSYPRRNRFEPAQGYVRCGTRTIAYINAAQRDAIMRDFEAAYATVPGHYRVAIKEG